MKEHAPFPRLQRRLRELARRPRLRRAAGDAAAAAAALLLAVPAPGGIPLPVSACLTLAFRSRSRAALAAVGSVAGYFLCFPWQIALEPAAAAVLLFAAAAIFRDGEQLPAGVTAAVITAAVGAVFLLDRGFGAAALLHYALRILCAALVPRVFTLALEERSEPCRLLLAAALAAGLAGLAPPFGAHAALAAAAAVSVSSAGIGILPTLLCGIGLDLSGAWSWSVTGALASGALLCRYLPRKTPRTRAVVLPAMLALWQLAFARLSLTALLSSGLGAFAGLVLPLRWPSERCGASRSPEELGARLRRAARVFDGLHGSLSGIPPAADRSEIADVYDAAAEQVCRLCVNYALCWEREAEQTYEDLCAAAGPMMRRGSALREDFPRRFVLRCRHTEGFITAVNRELEESLCRRRLRSRLAESRQILAGQYLFLARYLQRLSEVREEPPTAPKFVPELAVGSAGKGGSPISGDRGAALRDRSGTYYVLLCDGMGTGAEARAESDLAVRTLRGLLESGVAPDTAMEQLNCYYALQDSTCFSTVDLLQLSLQTGTGVLYKWGAAPSYCRTRTGVEKIGTAAPPPGLRVDGTHTAAQFRLSLREGETLVLVSDGAFGEETEGRIEDFHSGSVRDLASCIVAGAADGSDDVTAVVLRLRRELPV